MGAVPKQRLSTGRQGRRVSSKKLAVKGNLLTRTTKKARQQLKQTAKKAWESTQKVASKK